MNTESPLRCDQAIDDALAGIKLGRSRGKPALFKPLLLLLVLGRYWRNSPRHLLFREIHDPFKRLLLAYCGPDLHSEDTMYPFWHLQSSKLIWSVEGKETITQWLGSGSTRRPSISEARKKSSLLSGGFTEELYRRIIHDKVRMLEIVFIVLRKYFPSALHAPLLEAIEIPSGPESQERFSEAVLANYHYSCSICDFPGAALDNNLSLQVAFLKEPAMGGPESNVNSLAMCSQHKALLDIGAFTLRDSGKIEVAKYFISRGGPAYLLPYDRKNASLPKDETVRPSPAFLSWHNKHVFLEGERV